MKLRTLLLEVREPLRWHWYLNKQSHQAKLQVISPRGAVWDFKMSGGAWLRKSGLSVRPKKDS